MGIGKIEIILLIVLVIILLFVGAKKLPELARGVGQSAKELKKGFSEGLPEDEDKTAKKSSATKKK
ncbi:MAG: twin arginine-targeting protein translocase, TatA/E family [Candidatus Saccharibacteria bacterium]|nr:twin arginine-targeting protein translocase, TatA/E family [Candidatus Saccharibacteria bacterium]